MAPQNFFNAPLRLGADSHLLGKMFVEIGAHFVGFSSWLWRSLYIGYLRLNLCQFKLPLLLFDVIYLLSRLRLSLRLCERVSALDLVRFSFRIITVKYVLDIERFLL